MSSFSRRRATRKILEARAAVPCATERAFISVSSGHASVITNPACRRASISVDHPNVVLWAYTQTRGAPGFNTRCASVKACAIIASNLFLACQGCTEVFRIEVTDAAFQPDVEEIAQICIGDIVVVRRVSNYCIKCFIFKW